MEPHKEIINAAVGDLWLGPIGPQEAQPAGPLRSRLFTGCLPGTGSCSVRMRVWITSLHTVALGLHQPDPCLVNLVLLEHGHTHIEKNPFKQVGNSAL